MVMQVTILIDLFGSSLCCQRGGRPPEIRNSMVGLTPPARAQAGDSMSGAVWPWFYRVMFLRRDVQHQGAILRRGGRVSEQAADAASGDLQGSQQSLSIAFEAGHHHPDRGHH